jgi:hypothetical protein
VERHHPSHLALRLRKEHFVENPYGRRVYNMTPQEAQLFLFDSTLSDALQELTLELGDTCHALLADGLLVDELVVGTSQPCGLRYSCEENPHIACL